ncbi:hypothetical protein [Halomonas sp. CKK8]|uniref:hypothetical protein n=1 Tax=Halomonas sp. CKK8 TaxID=3036127 RepID=UPI002414F821|nr:hypothetical protein [Halomonas sp. CKK8]WFM70499.1 hypothetical protein P8934_13940 [Halomonas sp. CKK8]
MKQIANGLNELEDRRSNRDTTFGLVPSEITVNLKVDVKNTGSNTTSLSVAPAGTLKEVSRLGSEWKYEGSETRGSHITIKFRNLLFSKPEEAFYDHEDIGKRIEDLQNSGVEVLNPY